jgi:hypothetical protein
MIETCRIIIFVVPFGKSLGPSSTALMNLGARSLPMKLGLFWSLVSVAAAITIFIPRHLAEKCSSLERLVRKIWLGDIFAQRSDVEVRQYS